MITALTSTLSLPVREGSQVGEARRLAAAMTRERDFPATEVSKASLLATEAANNLVKHAGEGELIFHYLEEGDAVALEILSIDKGPGMADVDRCLEDGYSTAGSPGTGLGAMARLSSFFDIYTLPEQGTVVLMRLWAKRPRQSEERRFVVGGLSVPMPGEEVCGDAWAAAEKGHRLSLMVSDGLGHGRMAAEASTEAIRAFRENPARAPTELIHATHGLLRSTRGAAVAVTQVDLEENRVYFAGIGNIAATVLSNGSSRSMVSHNGIVGHQMHKVREMTYPWPGEALLMMTSDGIQTRWSLEEYPGLNLCHPTVIAAIMYRDFRRLRDDVTVAVAKVTV